VKVCQLCAVDFTLKHFLLPLVDAMRAKGWQVISICSDGPLVAKMRADGYKIETVAIARSMNPIIALRSLIALLRLFRRERIDVLHTHTPVASFIGRIAAKCAGVPLVVYTAHGFYFHEHMPTWKYTIYVCLERFCGLFTDLLFCQSAEDAAAAATFRIAPLEKITTIGNGVCRNTFDPGQYGDRADIRTSLGIPKNTYVIGLVGRQVEEKGIGDFLHAVTSLALQHSNLCILIAGERLPSDHSRSVVEQLLKTKELLDTRLIVLGRREDIPRILSAMDLFCLPSWREGVPRTIIEAMMMGKPVVATNIRGARELVVPGETGLLVPVRQPEALILALEKFLRNPAWGRKLGDTGRQRALKLYDEQKIIDMQLKIISTAIPKQSAYD
jgi:glycosyltransferase involved in cell wall biosynthesis